jgi:hypothetical protein
VLSDRELDTLRDIERRLRWENPELTSLFGGGRLPDDPDRRNRMRARMLVAAAALSGLALLGPRALDEARVGDRDLPPLTRTSPPETTGARSGAPTADTADAAAAPNGLAELVADDTPSRDGPEPQHQPGPREEQPRVARRQKGRKL